MTQKQIEELKKRWFSRKATQAIYLATDAKVAESIIQDAWDWFYSSLIKQHNDLKEKIKKMRKEEPKSEGDGGRTDLYTLGCNQIIDDILTEMEK